MPIASTQTQEVGCIPHWRRLLCTVLSPGLETGLLEHWDTGYRLTADNYLTLSGAENHKDSTQEGKQS